MDQFPVLNLVVESTFLKSTCNFKIILAAQAHYFTCIQKIEFRTNYFIR